MHRSHMKAEVSKFHLNEVPHGNYIKTYILFMSNQPAIFELMEILIQFS